MFASVAGHNAVAKSVRSSSKNSVTALFPKDME